MLWFICALLVLTTVARYPGEHRGWRGMSEEERAASYAANGYEWPPPKATKGWPPVLDDDSEPYKASRDRIEAHIRSIDDYKLHWDEFFGLAQSRLMPRFTPSGFKKLKAPVHLYHKLKDAYERGLKSLAQRENPESFSHKTGSNTPRELLPNFIGTHRLNDEVLFE